MIERLTIENFRPFRKLELPNLSRVNLIAGKNNVGKTSLLEAISLYVTKGDTNWILQLLLGRDEVNSIAKHEGGPASILPNDGLLPPFQSLFCGRTSKIEENELAIRTAISSLKIKIVFFRRETVEEVDETDRTQISRTKTRIIQSEELEESNDYTVGLLVSVDGKEKLVSLDSIYRFGLKRMNGKIIYPFQYLQIGAFDVETTSLLWDAIALSDKESQLLNALRLIEPEIQGVAFVEEGRGLGKRKAIIKVRNQKRSIPLKSMGDGINRILSIMLHAVNAENGILLIDEFENGLHYSILPRIWRLLFEVAEMLEIQIFVTTHSLDCIKAFSQVVNEREGTEGQLIRLDRKHDGEIKAVIFSGDEMDIAMDQSIELRA